jgi:ubiquinone/menaquinone biosynthesis C-methylase UbiE
MTMTTAKLQDKQKEIEFFDAHADADEYDVFTPEANARLIDAFKRLTGLPRGAKVADLGCGSGAFTEMLRREGYDAVGVDISPKLVAVGQSKYPGLNLIEGDVEHLPFADESFGTVLCTEVIEHIPDPALALAEFRRVLQPGGVLIGSVPARALIWKLRFLSSTCPHSEPFHNEYLPHEVRRMLDGWDVQRIRYSLLHFNVLFVARNPG